MSFAWFLLSMSLCVIGTYASIFTVTTHKNLHAWTCVGFIVGAFVNLLLIITISLKP